MNLSADRKEDHDLFRAIDGGTPESMALNFEEFDRANPQVWQLFCRFTFQLVDAGRKHAGAKMIAERIRWETAITTDAADFKINNNFTAFYARKFMKLFPIHEGLFATRKSVADHD